MRKRRATASPGAETSAPGATSRTRAPYWNASKEDLYKQLPLPTSSGTGSSSQSGFNCWCSKEERTLLPGQGTAPTSWRPRLQLPTGSSVCADTVKPRKKRRRGGLLKEDAAREAPTDAAPIKMRKLRMRLTKDQKKLLTKWMGSARFTYNRCLAAVKNDGFKMNLSLLRQRFVSESLRQRSGKLPPDKYAQERNFEVGAFVAEHPWLLDTPQCIRENAIRDLIKADESNTAKRQKNPDHTWELHFRQRTQPSGWTVAVSPKAIRKVEVVDRPETRKHHEDGRYRDCAKRKWTRLEMFPSFNLGPIWLTEAVPNAEITKECRITRDFTGHFYLCVPYEVPAPEPTVPEPDRKVVALDPGVRTFQTTYSPECTGGYAQGEGGFTKIYSLCESLDRAVSEASQRSLPRRQQNALRSKARRLRQRTRNLVDEAHKKVALDLVRRFDTILLPSFQTSQMVAKERPDGRKRKIRAKTARAMLTWAHYRFRERLIQKALEHGKEVVVCGERYTTQGCGSCGRLNQPGGSKRYKCAYCGLDADRDENAARNILLQYL